MIFRIFLVGLMSVMSLGVLVTDTLGRGQNYQLRFKMKDVSTECQRFVGLYTNRTLDADMIIMDEKGKTIAKVAGTAAKYPNEFIFPGPGIYTAKVMGYSGEGSFLMMISDREELKRVIKDIK